MAALMKNVVAVHPTVVYWQLVHVFTVKQTLTTFKSVHNKMIYNTK